MRVNMKPYRIEGKHRVLLNTWCQILAQEFDVKEEDARRWLLNSDHRDFVAKTLQDHGWKVQAYTTPPVMLDGSPRVISWGLIIDDQCDQLISLKLIS
jgi:hypothetical protein